MRRRAIATASVRAVSAYFARVPVDEPQKTQTLFTKLELPSSPRRGRTPPRTRRRASRRRRELRAVGELESDADGFRAGLTHRNLRRAKRRAADLDRDALHASVADVTVTFDEAARRLHREPVGAGVAVLAEVLREDAEAVPRFLRLAAV